jgi:hypothetical protein
MLDDENELLRLDTQGRDARHVGFGLALGNGDRKIDRCMMEMVCNPWVFE